MTRAHTLYRKHSKATLVDMLAAIDADPACRAAPGSLFVLNEKARKKSSDIVTAITYHMSDERAAAGRAVPTCGYSGRKSNRR